MKEYTIILALFAAFERVIWFRMLEDSSLLQIDALERHIGYVNEQDIHIYDTISGDTYWNVVIDYNQRPMTYFNVASPITEVLA